MYKYLCFLESGCVRFKAGLLRHMLALNFGIKLNLLNHNNLTIRYTPYKIYQLF